MPLLAVLQFITVDVALIDYPQAYDGPNHLQGRR